MLGALFSTAPKEWVVVDEAGLVVLDKPADIPCLGGRGTVQGDLSMRLQKGDASPSCPQPIDVAASGLVAFARERAVSRALAKAAEEAPLTGAFLSVVRGDRLRNTRLEHRIHKTRHGLSAEPAQGKKANAVTEMRVIDRGPGASLVQLRVMRGRAAQLRAQLAAAGAPMVGDRERGGPAARRLMLHACELRLPVGDRVHRSDEPQELLAWLREGASRPPKDRAELHALLKSAGALRWGLAVSEAGPAPTTAFRVVDGMGDGVPGLAVDLYGEHLVAHVYPDLLPLPEDDVLDVLGELGAAGVYVKRRPVQANELVDTRRADVAPATAVRGVDAPDELVVYEEGVPYLVHLGDGLSTGLFLDQRDNRARLRAWAPGKSVLNLFSYTCPFTVAAAVAGASRTMSIDAAGPALEAGRANVDNAAGAGEHAFLKADVFAALDDLARRGERFDVVVVDPPTYSTTKGSRWTSGKAWKDLAARALSVTAPRGRVLCCSNDRRLSVKKLLRHLEDALDADGRGGRVRSYPPPADFRPPPGGEAQLKSGVVELGSR